MSPFRWVALSVLLVPALALLPIVLWRLDLPFISSTSGPELHVFEIFAFLVSLTTAAFAVYSLRRNPKAPLTAALPTVIVTLLACHFAGQITHRPQPSPDWACYENGARAIVAGANPYDGTGYLYPPLTALALATAHRAVLGGAGRAGIAVDPEFAWQGVFYLYQCCQFFLVLGAIGLCFLLAKRHGATGATASVLVALLFVFQVPMARTLQFQQVNLWLLNSILFATLFVNAPVAAGFVIAFAIHLKLYAAILLLPFLLTRRFALVSSALIGFALILGLQTAWGADPTLWRQFLHFASGFTPGTAFRDNSLHGIVYNTLALGNRIAGIDEGTLERAVAVLTAVATLGVLFYFGRRAMFRERVFASERDAGGASASTSRLHGHIFDAIALALIASPLVWEHHYVLAIPLMLAAALTHGARRPWAVGLAAFLIGMVPVFDVYPFSYHRVAGLWLLLSITSPARDTAPGRARTP